MFEYNCFHFPTTTPSPTSHPESDSPLVKQVSLSKPFGQEMGVGGQVKISFLVLFLKQLKINIPKRQVQGGKILIPFNIKNNNKNPPNNSVDKQANDMK